MGTELLRPQGILSDRRLGCTHYTAACLPRERMAPSIAGGSHILKPRARRRAKEGSPGPAAVTKNSDVTAAQRRRGSSPTKALPMYEQAAPPRNTLLRELKVGQVETYAGSAFSLSPSPRALPLPRFSSKKQWDGGAVAVDLSATRDLRRLLGLV